MSYIPNILWIGALAVAMFAPANLDAATSDNKKRPSRDAVIETFLQVAFTDQASDEWQHARRWPASARIAIEGRYETEDATKVAHTRDLIRRVTQRNMPIFFSPLSADEKTQTQIVVAFVPRAAFCKTRKRIAEDFNHSSKAYGLFATSPDCQLALLAKSPANLGFAIVLVANEQEYEARAHCVTKKLVQAMGFPGEVKVSKNTVFDQTARAKPTLKDRALLWLLYHPEFKPELDTAKAAIRIRELLYRENLKSPTPIKPNA